MKNTWDTVMRLRTILSAFVLTTALVAGCSGGGSNGGGTTTVAAPTGTVTGQVASATNNAPVAGATVSTTAGTTTSAADGSFTVAASVGDRTVVHVEAADFAEAFPVARVTAGQTTNLGVRLLPVGVTTPVIIANGGTVTVLNSTAQVTIPFDGLVPKNGGAAAGTVNVALTPINPAVDTKLMPGDFNGVSAGGGSPVPIESFGALLIDIRDAAGTRYNLAPGKISTIRIPVGTLSANPPATIPLWFFDETTGLWKEEGTATLQGTAPNQFYEGTVTHFSYWNADKGWTPVFVTGCVRDNNGQPIANLMVLANGLDYSGSDIDFTAADGTFRVAIRQGSTATLYSTEFNIQTYTITTLTNLVNVGPSTVDFTLPNCLVNAPGPLMITTSALPGGNVGVAYNQTLAATGGIPGYAWSLNQGSNSLPGGLSLNPSGVISGTPTTAGTTAITVKVVDSASGSVTKQLSVTINPPGVIPVTITSLSPLLSGTVGTVYTIPLTSSGGTPPLSWSVVSGALPVGLTLNPSTGVINGTPTTQGSSTFTIRVQDSGTPPQFDQKPFSLTINAVSSGGGGGTLTVTNAPPSIGGTFVADPQATAVNVQGGIGAVGWGEVDSRNLTHTEGVTISFDATSGQVLSVLFVFADLSVGNAWTCSALLPPGCAGASVDMTAGTFTVVNTELRGNIAIPPITLNGTLTFPLGVVPVTITSLSPLPVGTVGIVYSTILGAFGGTPPLSWSVISGALPVGLTLDPSTGVLSGVPTTQATSTFTIRVQDSGVTQRSDQKQFSLTINAFSSGGGGGTLTVANAPPGVGGTFVANPLTTTQVTTLGSELLNWLEAPSQNFSYFEGVTVSFNLTDGEIDFVQFSSVQGTSGSLWICFTTINGLNAPCNGVTFNRTAGTVNFASTVVTDIVNPTPPITLNGTLTFTPF